MEETFAYVTRLRNLFSSNVINHYWFFKEDKNFRNIYLSNDIINSISKYIIIITEEERYSMKNKFRF